MLTIIKRFEFEAAHHLPKHNGVCRRTHGHRYELEIGISGPVDPETGMIADFKNLKKMVKDWVVDRLDHYDLNNLKIADFPTNCPTAENMVVWIVDQLQKALKITGTELVLVRLWETSGSRVEWTA